MNLILISLLISNMSVYKISKEIGKKSLDQKILHWTSNSNNFFSGLPNFSRMKDVEIKIMPQDLIIGDVPGETLIINYPFELQGNIIVINDGVLILNNAQLTLYGYIYALNRGKILIDSSYIFFPQVHIYQYGMTLGDSSYMEMKNSKTFGNYMPLNMSITGKAKADWINNDFSTSFFTTVLFEGSEIYINYGQLPGEYIMFDSARASFKNIDTLLIWFNFPDSSYVNFTFPPWGWLYNFVFDSTAPGVSGIDYHVDVDSSFYVMWGLFPSSGSDVTINDSEIRTIGIVFEHQSADTVRSLVNESSYSNFTLPLNDRLFNLVNTYVHTWSIYPWDTSFVDLSYSIVGEVLSMEYAFIISHHYFLDGSGGHLEASGNSANIVYLASLSCDIITKEKGILFIAYSSQILGNIWATQSSRMYLLQSEYSTEPFAYDSSSLIVGKIDYLSSYSVGDTISIFGDAYSDGGPLNTDFDLDHYTLEYQAQGDSNRYLIGSYTIERKHDTLGRWITQGLNPGNYVLILTLYTNDNDSVECVKAFNLYPVKIEEIKLSLEKKESPSVLYDVSGRRIGKLNRDIEISRFNSLPKGIYFIKQSSRTYKVMKIGEAKIPIRD